MEPIVTTLTPHGESWALILDAPMLEQMKIDPTTPLTVSSDGHSVTIVPVRKEGEEGRFLQALEQVNLKYGGVLKRLA